MAKKHSGKRGLRAPKTVLRLADLDQAKSAVLNSLSSTDAQRGYRHAIEEFIEWYCSEPRLSFSKSVVLRYRIHLESRHLASGTINLRLGAVRRLAYEASDCGLLSPDLAAGIRRVKGVKKIGVRLGRWLTAEQSQQLWNAPDAQQLKGKRDHALLTVLLACGLRRHEAANLDFGHIQQREEHWAIVDLKGKAGHTRTIPMPGWVKALLDDWLRTANLNAGKLFRRVNKYGKAWGEGLTEKAVWHEAGTSRSQADMCSAVSYGGRRTGTDSVPARACLDPDCRAIPRLQAAHSISRERPDRHRARGLTRPDAASGLPTNREWARPASRATTVTSTN